MSFIKAFFNHLKKNKDKPKQIYVKPEILSKQINENVRAESTKLSQQITAVKPEKKRIKRKRYTRSEYINNIKRHDDVDLSKSKFSLEDFRERLRSRLSNLSDEKFNRYVYDKGFIFLDKEEMIACVKYLHEMIFHSSYKKIVPQIKIKAYADRIKVYCSNKLLIKNDFSTNLIYEIIQYIEGKISYYVESGPVEKLKILAIKYGVTISTTSKAKSYIINERHIVLSEKSNPWHLVRLLEEDYEHGRNCYYNCGYLALLFVYALGFYSIKPYYNKYTQSSYTIAPDVIEPLNMASGRELIQKIKKFGEIKYVEIDFQGKKYLLIKVRPDKLPNHLGRCNFLAYNITNDHPVWFESKIYKEIRAMNYKA
ncbi:MAG TPA: hypothetical protein VF941_07895 [Clostridia bacterium]